MGFSSDEAGTLTAAAVGAALTGVKFLTAQAESALDAEQNTGLLTNGSLIKSVVAAGVNTLTDAVAGTDYLANDVISRQTLGADAQELVFALSDTDERVIIEGFGPHKGSPGFTVRFNDNATVAIYSSHLQVNGGAPSASTALIAGAWVGPGGFTLTLDLKDLNLKRGGFSTWWSANTADTNRSRDLGGFFWPNAADPVTSFTIRGSTADAFASGFTVICRRRKIT